MQITIPNSVTIELAKSGGQTYEVNLDNFDPSIIIAALTHGLKQKFADKLAGGYETIEENGEEKTLTPKESADRMYQQLSNGTWNLKGGSRGDAFESWASKVIAKAIAGQRKAKGMSKLTDKEMEEKVTNAMKNEDYMAKVRGEYNTMMKKKMEEKAEADRMAKTLDLADLGI